ncbi:hypothetical protein [Amycolatopsis silviterrae]|uniref:Uncharacterized protein n=1 Tax=Amycolatopsis silviterrae TaxID=1656914 RepID=A0ABW5H4U0_9PSEU
MSAVLVCLATLAVLIAAMLLLAEVGSRNGDCPHDTTLTVTDRRCHGSYQEIVAELHNPDDHPVLVGLSIRARPQRYRPTGGRSVRAPFRTCSPQLIASGQTNLAILLPNQTAAWHFAIPDHHRPLQLDTVIEQADRLRLIRHVVTTLPIPRSELP